MVCVINRPSILDVRRYSSPPPRAIVHPRSMEQSRDTSPSETQPAKLQTFFHPINAHACVFMPSVVPSFYAPFPACRILKAWNPRIMLAGSRFLNHRRPIQTIRW